MAKQEDSRLVLSATTTAGSAAAAEAAGPCLIFCVTPTLTAPLFLMHPFNTVSVGVVTVVAVVAVVALAVVVAVVAELVA